MPGPWGEGREAFRGDQSQGSGPGRVGLCRALRGTRPFKCQIPCRGGSCCTNAQSHGENLGSQEGEQGRGQTESECFQLPQKTSQEVACTIKPGLLRCCDGLAHVSAVSFALLRQTHPLRTVMPRLAGSFLYSGPRPLPSPGSVTSRGCPPCRQPSSAEGRSRGLGLYGPGAQVACLPSSAPGQSSVPVTPPCREAGCVSGTHWPLPVDGTRQ